MKKKKVLSFLGYVALWVISLLAQLYEYKTLNNPISWLYVVSSIIFFIVIIYEHFFSKEK